MVLAVLVLLDLFYIYNTKTHYFKMINNTKRKLILGKVVLF